MSNLHLRQSDKSHLRQTESGQRVIFSLASDLFATLVMTRRSHSVKGTKGKLALNKSKN